MFLQNKYTQTYYKIISRGIKRNSSEYTEKHHIIPKSLGGCNGKENIVPLTAREHFICHLLLTKMTEGASKNKMISAVFFLTGRGKAKRNNKIKSSRLYKLLKEQHAKNVSNEKKGCNQPVRTKETKLRLSKSKTGNLNPNFKCKWVTPWGTFESSRQASKFCPEPMSDVTVLNFCQNKNNVPISFLSVCRSKGWLTEQMIGKTPNELGFGVLI